MSSYSLRSAAADATGGALTPRVPARRAKPDGIGYGWQALLVVVSGLVATVDVFVDPPLTADDLPRSLADQPRIVVQLATLLFQVVCFVVLWALTLPGIRLLIMGSTLRQIGSALALGSWSAVIPSAVLMALALLVSPLRDVFGAVSAVVSLVYTLLSLAEFAGVGVGRAFAALLVGSILPLLFFFGALALIAAALF